MFKNLKSSKGSALLQVLVVSIIIATIAVFILRLSLSRSSTVVRGTALISGRATVENCQNEVNLGLTCINVPTSVATCSATKIRAAGTGYIARLVSAGIVNSTTGDINANSAGSYLCETMGTDKNGIAVQVSAKTVNSSLIYTIDPVKIDQAL